MGETDKVIGKVVDGLNAADNLTTTQEEELALLEKMHSVDMQSDSWLSKNIRPLFLIFSCLGWLTLVILNSFGVNISSEVTKILEWWGQAAIAFYFGSRGWEKVERTKMKRAVVDVKNEIKKARLERKKARLFDKLNKQ